MDSSRLLTRKEVEARCRVSTTTIYRMMNAGTFPRPVRIGQRAVRWWESDIDQYLAAAPRAESVP